jgi:hypothetical protein
MSEKWNYFLRHNPRQIADHPSLRVRRIRQTADELSEKLAPILDPQFVNCFTTHAKPFGANEMRARQW